MSDVITRLMSRKFILCLLATFINAYLVITKSIEPIVYRDIIIAIVAAYVGGNVAQKVWAKPL